MRRNTFAGDLSYCDKATFTKSPELSMIEKEFLIFSNDVIDWSNKHKITPNGTYILCQPESYYNSKKGEYTDTYTLINEYQKNKFRQNRNSYSDNAYYTREIPKGYTMKRICGIVSIVSPESEELVRKKNSHKSIVNTTVSTGIAGMFLFAGYRLLKLARSV